MTNSKGDSKSYSPKAYRIYPLFHKLFYSCLTIINRDNLSDYLIRKYYNFKDIPRFDSDNKRNLLEKMILDISDITDDVYTIKDVLNSPRMVHLREYYRYKGVEIDKPRTSMVIRLSDEVNESIKELAKNTKTIGEVIEIAIAYHITNAPNSYYDLITFTIQNQAVKDEEE